MKPEELDTVLWLLQGADPKNAPKETLVVTPLMVVVLCRPMMVVPRLLQPHITPLRMRSKTC